MGVRVSRLDNGLRVVSHQMPHTELVSLGLWVKAGSRRETEAQNGIAHFLEHMAFKGTKTRSARAIVEEIEQVGGDLNAATGLDQTSYFAQVLEGSLDTAVELIADIVLNTEINDEDLAHEADVICQEILAADDQPEERVFDRMMLAAFPGQAVGRPVMGRAEIVTRLKKTDLRSFLTQNYKAGDMVLSACGAVSHEELLSLAGRYFDALPAGCGAALAPASYSGGGVVFDEKNFEQAHMVVGFEGVGFCGTDIYTAQILNTVLGGGMASRLFQEVREARGLAYHVYSFHTAFEDGGLLGAYAATDPHQALATTEIIISEMQKIAEGGITARELSRARAQLSCGLAMVMESSSARVEQLARQLLFFDRIIEPRELLKATEAVTIEDCIALARKCIVDGPMTISIVGSGQKIGEFEGLTSSFASKQDHKISGPGQNEQIF